MDEKLISGVGVALLIEAKWCFLKKMEGKKKKAPRGHDLLSQEAWRPVPFSFFLSCCPRSVFQIGRSFLFMSLKKRCGYFRLRCSYGSGISGEIHLVLKSLQLSFKVKAQTKAKRS